MKCPYHKVGGYLCQKFFTRMGLEIHLLDDHKWTINGVEEYIHGQRSGETADKVKTDV